MGLTHPLKGCCFSAWGQAELLSEQQRLQSARAPWGGIILFEWLPRKGGKVGSYGNVWHICWIHFMLQRVYNNNLRKRMVDIKSISKGHAIYINLIRYSLLKWQVSRRRRLGTIHSKIPPEAISEVEAWKKQVQGVRVWRGQYGNLVAGGGDPMVVTGVKNCQFLQGECCFEKSRDQLSLLVWYRRLILPR